MKRWSVEANAFQKGSSGSVFNPLPSSQKNNQMIIIILNNDNELLYNM